MIVHLTIIQSPNKMKHDPGRNKIKAGRSANDNVQGFDAQAACSMQIVYACICRCKKERLNRNG